MSHNSVCHITHSRTVWYVSYITHSRTRSRSRIVIWRLPCVIFFTENWLLSNCVLCTWHTILCYSVLCDTLLCTVTTVLVCDMWHTVLSYCVMCNIQLCVTMHIVLLCVIWHTILCYGECYVTCPIVCWYCPTVTYHTVLQCTCVIWHTVLSYRV